MNWSGRADLNCRPLAPQTRIRRKNSPKGLKNQFGQIQREGAIALLLHVSRHKYFTRLPEPLNFPPEVSAYRRGDGGLRWTRRLEDKSSLDLQPRFALCSCADFSAWPSLSQAGKRTLPFMGDVADCTDGTSGNQLTLNCKGHAGTIGFTIHDDGSLTGPPGSFMPMLRKQK